jgi:hypothetical protein
LKKVELFEFYEGEVNEPTLAVGSPPPWVLLSLTRNSGHRTPKMERTYPEQAYGYATGYDPDYAPWGAMDHSGNYAAALTRRERRQAKRAARNIVPKGNLNESDYQFWRGYSASNYMNATCRWCEKAMYNAQERVEHFRKQGRCSFLIRATQNFAAGRQNAVCFYCNKTTDHRRWGFPLCDDVKCLGGWKFGSIRDCTGWMLYKHLARDAGVLAAYGEPKCAT